MRLFRRGKGHCEEREYDQHFVVEGTTGRLDGWFIDDIRMSLTEWTARHNRWSDAEVRDLLSSSRHSGVRAALTGNPLERKRFFRNFYNHPAIVYSCRWLVLLSLLSPWRLLGWNRGIGIFFPDRPSGSDF